MIAEITFKNYEENETGTDGEILLVYKSLVNLWDLDS